MRVVSLLPAATEMLYALDVEPVGVSHECDYPAQARKQPSVTSARIDPTASSSDIDDQVADAAESGGVFELDRELLARLDPDVVVTQGTCTVCAVDDTLLSETVSDLDLDARIVTIDPHSIEDVFDELERLGRRLDREQRASDVVPALRERVRTVELATPDSGPSVAILDWLDPVMVAGHWIPDLVERAGGTYDLAATGERSRPRNWAEIREYNPDVLVAAPCGFELPKIHENAGDLTTRPGWADLSAVRSGRVFAMDGHNYVNRPGPRLVDTLEALAGVLHGPEVVPADALEIYETAVQRWPTIAGPPE